jgi:superfamily II DNA or RNA helicase
MVVLIRVGNVYSRVETCTQAEHTLLNDSLCVSVPGHQFMPRFKAKRWDGMKRFYSQATRTFPTGFLPFILEEAHKHHFSVETTDERHVPGLQDPTRVPTLFPKARPYQQQALMQALTHTLRSDNAVLPWSRGIFEYPTDTGKTFIAGCLLAFLQKKTVYVVQRQLLMYQTQAVLQKLLPVPVGVLGDGKEDLEFPVVVAMAQTIQAALTGEAQYVKHLTTEELYPSDKQARLAFLRQRKEDMERFLSTRGCLIYDECHHFKDGIYHQIALKCPAPFRYGLSATPLKRGDLGDILMIGHVGEVIATEARTVLEEQGYIGKPHIFVFPIREPVVGRMRYPQAYRACIVENEDRNALIISATQMLLRKGCTILTLVKHREHGVILQQLYAQAGLKVPYISGQDSVAVRQQTLVALGTKIHVLLATKILNEGVDCSAISGIIRAGGGASEITSIQEVGRGRTKDMIYVVDFKDETHRDLLRHFTERLAAYRAQGFTVEFVKPIY